MSGKRLFWRLYPRVAWLVAVSLPASAWLVTRFDRPAAQWAVGVTLTAALAVAFSWAAVRWIAGPLAKVREAAERVAAGDFDHRLRLPDDAEMDRLTVAFQAM